MTLTSISHPERVRLVNEGGARQGGRQDLDGVQATASPFSIDASGNGGDRVGDTGNRDHLLN